MDDLLRLKHEELDLLAAKINLQTNLPHLHGWKFYQWAKDYFESREQYSFICAANQISKSSSQIRKHIDWATAPEKWEELWPNHIPRQFWYLYPTRDVAHVEWMKKWKPEFMPKGEFKDHPKFGWKEEIYHGRIFAIHWFSGVSTYFKTYAQDVQDLQTGTVARIDLDEETPDDLMGELMMRLARSEGYLSAVFTPTLGQEYWREVVEERGPKERFKGAFKRQVSMYDCLQYADGSPSPWTLGQIIKAENSCKSPSEIARRIHGKFVATEGRKYPAYHATANRKHGHPLPKGWTVYIGVDIGSGGEDNHPAAIVFTAVNPERTQGRVFKGWRGDGEVTTVPDIVQKLIIMMGEANVSHHDVRICYDWASRDFYNIATGMGLTVEPAEKSHDVGEQVLNALFKNQMLVVYDYPELDPLSNEFTALKNATPKNKAKDDFVDACRYSVTKVDWNWETIRSDYRIEPEAPKLSSREEEILARRGNLVSKEPKLHSIEEEFDLWNELMGVDSQGFHH